MDQGPHTHTHTHIQRTLFPYTLTQTQHYVQMSYWTSHCPFSMQSANGHKKSRAQSMPGAFAPAAAPRQHLLSCCCGTSSARCIGTLAPYRCAQFDKSSRLPLPHNNAGTVGPIVGNGVCRRHLLLPPLPLLRLQLRLPASSFELRAGCGFRKQPELRNFKSLLCLQQ